MADTVNLSNGIVLLISWSALASAWWLTAFLLVAKGPPRWRSAGGSKLPTLSVFKPIPPVRDDAERAALAEAMESFIAQLDCNDELLTGVDLGAFPDWEGKFDQWRATWPEARIVIIAQPNPSHLSNPKIAWMEVLAARAQGELWLWSDADVIAPPECLRMLKHALIDGGAGAITAAYAVRCVSKATGMLDALFVNVELLPGALLLGRLGVKEFAYGAATMFRATTFRDRVQWADLGAQLADDHELGRRLKPVDLAGALVSTFTLTGSWREALEHYYRWQKTVRWCRPGGFAAMILVIPLIGWAAACVIAPGSRTAWAGFAGQWLLEILVAAVLCSVLDCRLPPRTWGGLLLWPLVRMISWMGTWLPLRVFWGGRETAWSAPAKLAEGQRRSESL